MVEKLKVHFELVEAGGAGYKILCVVLGLVDIYITSKPSTYKWDTCAGTYVDVRKCRSVYIATFLCYFSSYLFIPFSLRTLLKFSVKLHRSRRCAAIRCIFKPTIAQKPIWVLSICHNYEKLAPFSSFWYLFTGQGLLRSMGGNIVEFTQPTKELSYNQPNADQSGIQKWCNDHGLIAFRHKSELDKLITMLK